MVDFLHAREIREPDNCAILVVKYKIIAGYHHILICCLILKRLWFEIYHQLRNFLKYGWISQYLLQRVTIFVLHFFGFCFFYGVTIFRHWFLFLSLFDIVALIFKYLLLVQIFEAFFFLISLTVKLGQMFELRVENFNFQRFIVPIEVLSWFFISAINQNTISLALENVLQLDLLFRNHVFLDYQHA